MSLIKRKNKYLWLPTTLVLALFLLILPKIAQASEDLPVDKSAEISKNIDSDQDRLKDVDEINIFNTDPNNPDSDSDGFNDGVEVKAGYSPLQKDKIRLSTIDTDNDGLQDSWEIRVKTNLSKPDTDNDGIKDGDEVKNGTDPKSETNEKIEKSIKVSLKDQKLSYYFGSAKLDEFLISSGVKRMPSPTGNFTILDKVPSKNYGGVGYNFYYPDTKWNLHFYTSQYRYYIHGAYWHDKFGQPMSHGCINVSYKNMGKLYDFAQVGTKLTIL